MFFLQILDLHGMSYSALEREIREWLFLFDFVWSPA